MHYKAIAFDIDGTLYPNWKMYLKSVPFAVKHLPLIRAFSQVRFEIRSIHHIDNFMALQSKLLAEKLNISQESALNRINTILYRDWEKYLKNVSLYSGALELVQEIRAAGLKTAVASDFPVVRKLGILGIEGLWDFELSTEDTNYLKPNPKPFEAIIDALGIPAAQILYVGNSYKYDILGAKGVGMAAAHLTKKKNHNSEADFSFSNYKELRAYLFQ